MPHEAPVLARQPYPFERCPRCQAPFPDFMRGQVQRSKRFLGVLWPRPSCAVICPQCHTIIGWEWPPKERR